MATPLMFTALTARPSFFNQKTMMLYLKKSTKLVIRGPGPQASSDLG